MLKNIRLLLFILSLTIALSAQSTADVNKIYRQMIIKENPEIAWKAITENFGHVGNHHTRIKYAYTLDNAVTIGEGTIRYSQINREKYIKELITTFDESQKNYTTTIFESTSRTLPIHTQTVGIKQENGQTYVYQTIQFTSTTRPIVGKIKKWNRAYLKAYKEVIMESSKKEDGAKQFQQRFASMLY